ncbi:glycosyl hydrolase family 25 [Chitinophaga niastensis]|uniref:Glycosyl hydrolase family 25 n=1 Tax=Chitinophaga niastensis TaxID=536980 RepID=A0A2P8HJY7_CHINA|nr:glycoside hydrolase family 25 protein [Chitinophaga niastensis]PSL46537.1 glycosyl hydrolase family 25 [Chitinophaga niastensis]
MQLIVTVKKLNKRNTIPKSFAEKHSIIGTVLQGYKFEGEEVKEGLNSPLGKWYKDRDGFYYWGGGLIIAARSTPQRKIITVGGLPLNLPEGYMLGADLSHYNDRPDWAAINRAGVSFVYLKISEGVGSQDSKVKEHADNALQLGIKVGYYHFCRPDRKNTGTIEDDAVAEANNAINLFQHLPAAQLPLALDLENENNWDTPLEKIAYTMWIETFIAHVQRVTGTSPVIYSRKEYLDRKLPPNHTLGKYRLWLANYSVTDCHKLACPHGWSDWAIWQFTDKAGIGGNAKLDLSILKDPTIIPLT